MLFRKKENSINKGISFGVTSGVITTLGLIVSLDISTQSKLPVLAGILTIAVADSFSDAMGMHVSEESHSKSSTEQVWRTTVLTLVSKIMVAMSFCIPIIAFPLELGVLFCIAWGISITTVFSYKLATSRKENPFHTIAEHLSITIFVIIASYVIGNVISRFS